MKKVICSLTAAAIICSGFAFAASSSYTASAKLRPDVSVNIDGKISDFYNVQGEELFPIIYNNSTYLPIRSIGEIMGKNVNWDSTTKTATIAGERVTDSTVGTPNNNAQVMPITITCRPDYIIVIDGTARTFKDADGNVIQPMLYNGSIYLPLRAIGEIMGKNVSWNATTQTAILTDSNQSSGEVTDFDTQNPTTPTTPTTGNITLEQAKQVALNHAGKTASQVQFVKAYKEWDDGIEKYEIEFIITSNNIIYEYDYEISTSGKIISYDYDAEGYTPNYSGGSSTGSATVAISEAQAKQIALNKVSGATTSNIYEFKLDRDDGRYKYEGKIIYGTWEYEFEIDANTGNIIEWDRESIYD